MNFHLRVAIDGPAGAGKSTVSKMVAHELNLVYVDTGAMYRAVTWKVLQEQIDLDDEDLVSSIACSLQISFEPTNAGQLVFVNQEDVTQSIRTPEVTAAVSKVSAQPGVRSCMVDLQRQMVLHQGVVMDGRDIGTHVIPDAEVKIFLTASLIERALRRFQEMRSKGYEVNLEEIEQDIHRRDQLDSNREVAPLRQASDAVKMDTTGLTIEQVVQKILDVCRKKIGTNT